MADTVKYERFNLLLDPNDKDDKKLIKYLRSTRTRSRKNSYSAILKKALKFFKEKGNQ